MLTRIDAPAMNPKTARRYFYFFYYYAFDGGGER